MHVPVANPHIILESSQDEICLTGFNFCLDCRAGSCTRHGIVGTTVSEADRESTRQALELIGWLPPELKILVACQLDVATLFSIKHAPAFREPLWDNPRNRSTILRKVLERFSLEGAAFPQSFLQDSTVAREILDGAIIPDSDRRLSTLPHYLLFLEVFHKATNAVAEFLAEELLPADFRSCHFILRAILMPFWRLFGVKTASTAAETEAAAHEQSIHRKQEVIDYYMALPPDARDSLVRNILSLGRLYQERHPLDLVARGVDPGLAAEIMEQSVIGTVAAYFMIEYLRAGMQAVFKQASSGGRVAAREAFSRGGMAPWAAAVGGNGGGHASDAQPAIVPIELDAWTYRAVVTEHTIALLRPRNHRADLLWELLRASRLPAGARLDWKSYDQASSRTNIIWRIPRAGRDRDDQDDLN